MYEVVVVGSLNMDLVARADRMPRVGETILGGQFAMFPGGKGANQAVATGRLGARVAMVGRVGDDIFGERLVESLRAAGVATEFVRPSPGTASGVALITVGPGGENAIVVCPGANALLSVADVEAAGQVIRSARVLLVQLEVPLDTVERAMRLARSGGVTVVLDPAPAGPLPDGFLGLADIVTPNEIEAGMLTGRPVQTLEDARAAGEALLRHAGTAIVKLGARGALVVTSGGAVHVPAVPVNAVDTTAAGDAFAGGLAVALARGRSLEDAVRYASLVAALSTTRPGAQPAMPAEDEVRSFASSHGLAAGQA